jgi:hypothetical protein
MSARTKRISNDANTRAKIQTTKIIQRLQKHIDGDLELSNTQVLAATTLLKKTLPDQKAMELSGELNIPQVITKDLSGQ